MSLKNGESPVRVQRLRTKGYRLPPNTVYVGRGTKWGNPFRVGDGLNLTTLDLTHSVDGRPFRYPVKESMTAVISQELAVDLYGVLLRWRHVGMSRALRDLPMASQVRTELAGKNLACWCPPDQPCHADVLLEIANREEDAA